MADVLGETRYALTFLLLLVVLGFIFGAVTGIILLSPLDLNQIADPYRVATTAATAVLTAATLTVSLRNHQMKTAASGAESMTVLGVFMSIFVGSCPLCQPIWLFWVGLGTVSGVLGAIGLIFGLASIAFLVLALKTSIEAGMCEMKR